MLHYCNILCLTAVGVKIFHLWCGLPVYDDIEFALAATECTHNYCQVVCANAVGKCSTGPGDDLWQGRRKRHTVIQGEIKERLCGGEVYTKNI